MKAAEDPLVLPADPPAEAPRGRFLLACTLVALAVLAFDTAIPLGVAGGVPYIALVLMGFRSRRPRDTIALALTGSALTVLGYLLSEPLGIPWMVVTNRALALFAIWVTALAVWQRQNALLALERHQGELEHRVAQRTEHLVREIAHREEAEAALAASEKRFRDVAESSSDWIWEMGPDLRFTSVTGRASEILCRDGSTFVGKRREDLIGDPDSTPGLRAHLEDLKAHRPFRDFEYEAHLPNGNVRTVRISGRPVFAEDGTFQGYRGTGADVSSEKRILADLRTAKEEAELANRAKTEFLANMSHELRTPLNAVIGFSGAMSNQVFGPLPGKYLEYAEDIRASGEHLLGVITDVLDVSRIEAGKLELDEEEVDPDAVVDAVLRLVRERADDAGVALAREGTAPEVKADARRLKQILLNLVTNGVKFTAADGSVTVRTGQAAGDGVTIAVTDTGSGIAPEDLPLVLRPFEQADGGLARPHEGVGLGLPLARSLTEMHGGRLEIESEPGKGTTVTVRLPAERVVGA